MRETAPYLRIAAEIRSRIASGALAPGQPVPSTRQITREWGVAMATATKVLTVLRNEGLVESRPGAGTVVRRAAPRPVTELTRERLVRAGVTIADAEGLDAVSLRRLAAGFRVVPAALYRHVPTKDALVRLMMRAVFAEGTLEAAGHESWRARLELVCREQWRLYRRHPWLAALVSMTRPVLMPEAMAHTEFTLAALDGLGLTDAERAREALALPAFVRGLAMSLAAEADAEQATGLTAGQWWQEQDAQVRPLLATGRFPRLARMVPPDLDTLLEHGLARHLDGLEAIVRERR